MKHDELLIDKRCCHCGFDFWNCFLLVSLNFHRLVIKPFFVEWKSTYEINTKKVNTLSGGAFHHVRKLLPFSKMKNLLGQVEQEHCLLSNPTQEKIFVLWKRGWNSSFIWSSGLTLNMANKLTIIHLKEVQPRFPNFIIKSSTLNFFWHHSFCHHCNSISCTTKTNHSTSQSLLLQHETNLEWYFTCHPRNISTKTMHNTPLRRKQHQRWRCCIIEQSIKTSWSNRQFEHLNHW